MGMSLRNYTVITNTMVVIRLDYLYGYDNDTKHWMRLLWIDFRGPGPLV